MEPPGSGLPKQIGLMLVRAWGLCDVRVSSLTRRQHGGQTVGVDVARDVSESIWEFAEALVFSASANWIRFWFKSKWLDLDLDPKIKI